MIKETILHNIQAHAPSILKEIVNNISEPWSLIREMLSNSADPNIKATKIKITYYSDPEYGLSFIFEDNGIGMDYSEDLNKMGRLNRFLNFGYSKGAGFDDSLFGQKGLGSKLCYACKSLEIETYPIGSNFYYQVKVDDPIGHLNKDLPELPQPQIIQFKRTDSNLNEHKTIIKIRGYRGGGNEYKLKKEKLIRKIKSRTIAGCTKEELIPSIPEISLKYNVDGSSEERIKVGFPWIEVKETNKGKAIFLKEPIIIQKPTNDPKTDKIEVRLKGGFSIIPIQSDVELIDGYNSGLVLSVNGIPYCELDLDYYLPSDYVQFSKRGNETNFVVECDSVNMLMGREGIIENDEVGIKFRVAVKEAFKKLGESDVYKNWHIERLNSKLSEDSKQRAESINALIDEIQNTHYIFYGDELIHRVPDNEKDTLAILWKLESRGLLPFNEFKTLAHTNYKGVDLVCKIQLDEFSAVENWCPVEVENDLNNFDHDPRQLKWIICWSIKNLDRMIKRNELEIPDPQKPFFMRRIFKDYNNHMVNIFALQKLNKISIRRFK